MPGLSQCTSLFGSVGTPQSIGSKGSSWIKPGRAFFFVWRTSAGAGTVGLTRGLLARRTCRRQFGRYSLGKHCPISSGKREGLRAGLGGSRLALFGFLFHCFLFLRRETTVAGRERQRDHDWLVHKPGDAKAHDHEAPIQSDRHQRGVVSRSNTVGSGRIGLWLGGTGALRKTDEQRRRQHSRRSQPDASRNKRARAKGGIARALGMRCVWTPHRRSTPLDTSTGSTSRSKL
jgi:hypothetical protein